MAENLKYGEVDDVAYIYGRNPVMEAVLARPDVVETVFIKKDSKDAHLLELVNATGIAVAPLFEKQLPGGLDRGVVHQGVVAEIRLDTLMVPYQEFIEVADVTPKTGLLVLGEVQDPHNAGAAIRSAAAFGISAVLIPPHNQAPINGTVAKVSAGMIFKVPLVRITNVNATITDLKKRGFWTYGLDGRGEQSLPAEPFEKPSVFVIGNEGSGLRKMTAETCDTLLSIPIDDRCESMNASASVAIALYDWSTKRQ